MNGLDYDQTHQQYYNDLTSYLNIGATISEEISNYILQQIDTKKEILEIGAGGGHFANYIMSKGYKVKAMDISHAAISKAKENYPNLEIFIDDAEKLDVIENDSIDVVISIEVLEHLRELDLHFKNVARALKRNGIYIVKTPNKWLEIIYYKHILLRKDSNKEHMWWKGHISLCSLRTLKHLAYKHHFNCTFLRQKKLALSQERKIKLILPRTFSLPLIFLLNFLLQFIPKSLAPSIIGILANEK